MADTYVLTAEQMAVLTGEQLAQYNLEVRALQGLDVPPPLDPATQPVQAQVVHTEQGGGYASYAVKADAAGKTFHAGANALFQNNNVTWVDLYVEPAGGGVPQVPNYRVTPVNKLENVALTNSLTDLIVGMTTHTLGGIPGQPRPINLEMARVVGVFATSPQFEAEEGGAGVTIVPVTPQDVDYEQIRQIMRTELGLRDGEASLIGQFAGSAPAGSSTIRKGLDEKVEGGIVNQLGHIASAVQGALYMPTIQATWLDLEKMVQGTDNPVGMNAQQLHDALVALIRSAR